MYSDQLTSELAKFVAMRTDHMKKIRDHLPSGPEFFKFYHIGKELNWYSFWDLIAEHRPHHCKLVTDLFTIEFDEPSLKWEITHCELDQNIQERAREILRELTAYEKEISLLRQWLKSQSYKK